MTLLRVPRKTAAGLERSSRVLHEQEEQIAYAGIKLSDQLMVQKLKKLPSMTKNGLIIPKCWPLSIMPTESRSIPERRKSCVAWCKTNFLPPALDREYKSVLRQGSSGGVLAGV